MIIFSDARNASLKNLCSMLFLSYDQMLIMRALIEISVRFTFSFNLLLF